MLHYTVVFFIIAIIAAVFGFGGIAAGATEIAKILFFVFLIITVISFIMGRKRQFSPTYHSTDADLTIVCSA